MAIDEPEGVQEGGATRPPQRILLACNDEAQAEKVRAGLLAGQQLRLVPEDASGLQTAAEDFRPDLLIVCSDRPRFRTIRALEELAGRCPLPVVMFVETDDAVLAQRALQAGVSSYIVRGLSPERIGPVLQIAAARFRMIEALHKELLRSRDELAARKAIERAKGLLMERRGLSEHEAYETMRREAMAQGRSLREIAEMVLSVSSIFP